MLYSFFIQSLHNSLHLLTTPDLGEEILLSEGECEYVKGKMQHSILWDSEFMLT